MRNGPGNTHRAAWGSDLPLAAERAIRDPDSVSGTTRLQAATPSPCAEGEAEFPARSTCTLNHHPLPQSLPSPAATWGQWRSGALQGPTGSEVSQVSSLTRNCRGILSASAKAEVRAAPLGPRGPEEVGGMAAYLSPGPVVWK